MSIAAAVQAASDAVCADCRLNHILLKSIANAIAPIRNIASASTVISITWPASRFRIALPPKVVRFMALLFTFRFGPLIRNNPIRSCVQSKTRPTKSE
jgi:hypothetical protein